MVVTRARPQATASGPKGAILMNSPPLDQSSAAKTTDSTALRGGALVFMGRHLNTAAAACARSGGGGPCPGGGRQAGADGDVARRGSREAEPSACATSASATPSISATRIGGSAGLATK